MLLLLLLLLTNKQTNKQNSKQVIYDKPGLKIQCHHQVSYEQSLQLLLQDDLVTFPLHQCSSNVNWHSDRRLPENNSKNIIN